MFRFFIYEHVKDNIVVDVIMNYELTIRFE